MASLGSCFELLACVFSSPLRWLVFAGFPRFVLPPFSWFSGFALPACCLSVLFLSALLEMLRTSAHERGVLACGGFVLYAKWGPRVLQQFCCLSSQKPPSREATLLWCGSNLNA